MKLYVTVYTYHLRYGTCYVDRVATIDSGHVASAHHQIHSRKYDGVELTEYPLAAPTRAVRTHPDLAHVIKDVLIQQTFVTHVYLVICIID
jgi:hypothetical protein